MGRVLAVSGLLIAGVGVLMMLGFPLGRLPGDVVYRRGGMTLYLPIASSLLVSIGLSLVVMFVRR